MWVVGVVKTVGMGFKRKENDEKREDLKIFRR